MYIYIIPLKIPTTTHLYCIFFVVNRRCSTPAATVNGAAVKHKCLVGLIVVLHCKVGNQQSPQWIKDGFTHREFYLLLFFFFFSRALYFVFVIVVLGSYSFSRFLEKDAVNNAVRLSCVRDT